MKPTIETARKDERGAIMVAAVFMAAFLVSSLWYVAGVGNASLFRESMQSGADAGAFAGAVFHARGMNIIAMINLIMAAILAVLVALKIAKLLLTITYAIATALCPWTGFACPIAAAAKVGDTAVGSTIKTVEPIINNTLVVLSKLQVAIAKIMPVVSLAKSHEMAKKYNKPVEGGLMISESIIPTNGFGLPVEEDEYSVLCKKAAEFVADFALAPFSAFGVSTKWAKGLVVGLVEMAPSYFCGSDSGGGSGGMTPGLINSSAKQICDAQKKAIEENNKDSKKPKQKYNNDECMKKETQNLQNSNSGGKQFSGSKTPKKVREGAKNGDKNFQVMTYAWGNMELADMGRTQVKLAAWGKNAIKPPPFWGKVQFAMAEFYYDDSGSWDDLKEDAMWNMKWRARLRRYHKEIAPGGQLASAAMNLMSAPSGILDAIDFMQGGGIDSLMGNLGGNSENLSSVYTKQGTRTEGGQFEKIEVSGKMEPIH
jgi:hypothetical protein